MQDKLIDIKNEAVAQILSCTNESELEKIRIYYLGKSKGKITQILKQIPKMEDLEKAAVGKLVNEVKKIIEDSLASQGVVLRSYQEKNIGETEKIDVTLPGIFPPEGHLHPLTQVLHEVLDIFKSLGYQVTNTHEIQTDYYNFTALNTPADSPSRDMQATFYLDTRKSKTAPGEIILQTQVTSMQVKILEKTKPPVRCVMPGKVYRVDELDPSHGFEFWQIDGFLIDKNIHMTDLLGTIEYVLRKLYGQEIKIRFDATNFPFVEPGVQAFMSCTICKQKGCPFCKRTGWVEILPAGMIHPNVLKNAGLDPKEWGGFAFDLGLSRAAVLKNQIDDLRTLTNPDLKILKQF